MRWLCDQGQPDEAIVVLGQIPLDRYPRFAALRAAVLCEAGRVEDAARYLPAITAPGFADIDQGRSYALAYTAETIDHLAEHTAAGAVQEQLKPWAGQFLVLGSGAICLGAAAHYLGLAYRAANDLPTALDHFHEAVYANDSARLGSPAVRSRAELARTLARAGYHRDARRAASRAAALARRLGMTTWLRHQRNLGVKELRSR
jgi:tetratricopeptide (TPR) repeat protein